MAEEDFLGNQTRMIKRGMDFLGNQMGLKKNNNNNMIGLVPARIESGGK